MSDRRLLMPDILPSSGSNDSHQGDIKLGPNSLPGGVGITGRDDILTHFNLQSPTGHPALVRHYVNCPDIIPTAEVRQICWSLDSSLLAKSPYTVFRRIYGTALCIL